MGHYQTAPIWQNKHPFFKNTAPKMLQAWLTGRESLTHALTCTCRGHFAVRVLEEGWQKPMLNESIALGLKSNAQAFIRQVHLFCNDQCWVYARSVIPDHTLHGELQKLTRLGSKPLGAVLFANKHINRGAIEIGRVSRGHQLHRTALMFSPEKPRQVWGRRSLFYITRHPLLVNEFFLPQIQPKSFTRHAS